MTVTLVRKDRSEAYTSLTFSLSNRNFSIAIQRRDLNTQFQQFLLFGMEQIDVAEEAKPGAGSFSLALSSIQRKWLFFSDRYRTLFA